MDYAAFMNDIYANSAERKRKAEEPVWVKKCDCGRTVERWRGQGDVFCDCGASYNAFGQRLRDDWQSNPSWSNEEIGDMEGFEVQQAADDLGVQ